MGMGIVNNLLEYIEENKNNIQYCECVIDKFGNCYNAIPSHTQYLARCYRELKGKSQKDIPILASPLDYMVEDLGYVAVWYGFATASKLTSYQIHSLIKLRQMGIISSNFSIRLHKEKTIIDYQNKYLPYSLELYLQEVEKIGDQVIYL